MARRPKVATCSRKCKGRKVSAFRACVRACVEEGRKSKSKKRRRRR